MAERDFCYDLDFLEQLLEELIIAVDILIGILCPLCGSQSLHQVFRENPDGSYDEVGMKCHKCNKIV